MCDFEIDDGFLLEALEDVEKTEVVNSLILSTPPDSEMYSRFRSTEQNVCKDNSSVPDLTVTPESNFRAQLMKSLLHTRNNSSKLKNTLNLECSKNEDMFTPQKTKRKFCDNNLTDFHPNVIDSFTHSKCARLSAEPDDFINKHLRNQQSAKENSHYTNNPGVGISSTSSIPSPTGISPNTSTVRKRKFPGPAGLLPKWEHRVMMKSNLLEDDSSEIGNNSAEDTVCSQTTAQDFASGPWNRMLVDLRRWENVSKPLFQSNNIRWILRRASLRGQAFMRKIAFLVVMVKSMDPSHTDATAVFQDETGEIHGTVSNSVLENFPDAVLTGTVFVLRDVTLLSPASLQPGIGIMSQLKKHYLNITLNSVLSLYSLDEQAGTVKRMEVVPVNRDLLLSLLSANENRERRKVFENEDKEKVEVLPLFETCNNLGKEDCPRASLNPRNNFPKYKNPVPNTKSVPPPQNLTVNQIHSNPAASSRARPATSHQQSASRPFHNEQQTFNESAAKLKCTAEAFESFSDDEFDTILASINTDSL